MLVGTFGEPFPDILKYGVFIGFLPQIGLGVNYRVIYLFFSGNSHPSQGAGSHLGSST